VLFYCAGQQQYAIVSLQISCKIYLGPLNKLLNPCPSWQTMLAHRASALSSSSFGFVVTY